MTQKGNKQRNTFRRQRTFKEEDSRMTKMTFDVAFVLLMIEVDQGSKKPEEISTS